MRKPTPTLLVGLHDSVLRSKKRDKVGVPLQTLSPCCELVVLAVTGPREDPTPTFLLCCVSLVLPVHLSRPVFPIGKGCEMGTIRAPACQVTGEAHKSQACLVLRPLPPPTLISSSNFSLQAFKRFFGLAFANGTFSISFPVRR